MLFADRSNLPQVNHEGGVLITLITTNDNQAEHELSFIHWLGTLRNLMGWRTIKAAIRPTIHLYNH